MSNIPLLNLAALTFSILNTIMLLWLGLTVLLNSDRRAWGIWITSGSLLMGAAFFATHTIILQSGFVYTDRRFAFWWLTGLTPAHFLPFAWYIVMLWYAGYWQHSDSALKRRQRPLLLLIIAGMISGLIALVAIPLIILPINPFDVFYNASSYSGVRSVIPASNIIIPLLGGGYSLYMILCILAALDAVFRPAPSNRPMGDLARQRARPWLVAASGALLLVSLLVSYILYWIWNESRQRFLFLDFDTVNIITVFDLIILCLLTTMIILMGQAAVSYELFTGKTLPRRGLQRHWYSTLLVGSLFSLLISSTIIFRLLAVYGMLLVAIFATGFAAYLGWRSYKEREHTINSLRPFVHSERLFDNLITQSNLPSEMDVAQPFTALCRDVLGAEAGYLTAVGSLTPLITTPLTYPAERPLPPCQHLTSHFTTPAAPSLPLNPDQYGGASWAIPLWSQRGLIGLFLIGNKTDGTLYTQEEIEIARASGERLMDTQASAELARRLINLQREQMIQSQIIDQQTRRILHDDVLPQLHTAMLALAGSPNGSGQQEAVKLLTDAHKDISNLLREIPHTAGAAVTRLGLIGALKKVVDNELAHTFDHLEWEISPEVETRANQIPSLTAEVVFYAAREAIRNAAKYGRLPDRPLELKISATWNNGLNLIIEDNGPGLTPPANPAADQQAGSGHGLALHSTMLAVVGGQLSADSAPGRYTRITLSLPDS